MCLSRFIHITYFLLSDLPEIILAPENQLVIAGKSITLECDADGVPDPDIIWYFNGNPLTTDERRIFDNENTELNINNAIKNDTGKSL